MVFSGECNDHGSETEENERETSRYVVSADQLREGAFKTLGELRMELGMEDE